MGDTRFRDYTTSRKIGRFRQKLLEHIDRGTANDWLNSTYYADGRTAKNLVHYYQRQRESIQAIPTDTQFMVESTTNADGQPVFFLHAPLGGRVNGAWAVALAAALERHWQTTVQYSFDDDGIMMRLPNTTEKPPLEKLFKLSCTGDLSKDEFAALTPLFSSWLKLPSTLRPKNRIEISQINDHPAASSKFAEALIQIGYEKAGDALILWPSVV